MRALAPWRVLRAQLFRPEPSCSDSSAGTLISRLVLPASFYLMIAAYQLCNWYNQRYADGVLGQQQLAVPVDGWIPFTPWALPLYLSFFGFFFLHRSLLSRGRSGRLQYRAIEFSLNVVTVISSACFLWFPSEVELRDPALQLLAPGLAPGLAPQWLASACAGLYALDGSFNAWPSLHVSLPLLIMLACTRLALFARWQALWLWLWLIAVVGSVLLLKQHYLWDVVSAGLLVALVWVLWLRPRLLWAGAAAAQPALQRGAV
jgi:hypothetical protein